MSSDEDAADERAQVDRPVVPQGQIVQIPNSLNTILLAPHNQRSISLLAHRTLLQ